MGSAAVPVCSLVTCYLLPVTCMALTGLTENCTSLLGTASTVLFIIEGCHREERRTRGSIDCEACAVADRWFHGEQVPSADRWIWGCRCGMYARRGLLQ